MRRAVPALALSGWFAACSAAPPGPGPEPGALEAALAVASQHPSPSVPAARGSAPDRHPAPTCTPPAGAAAWLACDGRHIDAAAPIVAHPMSPVPPPAARVVLDAVAALMAAHPHIHLLRIEAYSSRAPGSETSRIRREIVRSQERADAVFRYLWQTRHVSPERMEAVGLGWVRSHARAGQRWPIELRVVERGRGRGAGR